MDPTIQGSYNAWLGRDVFDTADDKIGTIEEIYYDDQTGHPEWLTVKTGLFGTGRSFVPIVGSSTMTTGGEPGDLSGLRVAYSKDLVKDAPRIDEPDGHLTPEDEQRLYNHYNIQWEDTSQFATEKRADYGYEVPPLTTTAETSREFVSEQEVGTEDEVATHAEIPHMAKETVQTGRVRLRRYLITEQVTMPVTHEEIRVERDVDLDIEQGEGTTDPTRRDA